MTLGEIERKIASNELTAEQVFTQMKQHIISRNSIIDEAVSVVGDCELVEPNVQRIRLYEAIGALLMMKS